MYLLHCNVRWHAHTQAHSSSTRVVPCNIGDAAASCTGRSGVQTRSRSWVQCSVAQAPERTGTSSQRNTQTSRTSQSTLQTLPSHLPQYERGTGLVELLVAGAGPSGLAVAERVSQAGFKVCIVDPAPLRVWPNNYGVWVDEFAAMGLDDCIELVWPQAKVYLDSGPQGERFLKRPYGRVDRPKLKHKLLQRCIDNGVVFHTGLVEDLEHREGHSCMRCKDGTELLGRMVLDATGHARRLIQFDEKFDPGYQVYPLSNTQWVDLGYQAAYGIIAEVESHPFDLDSMLFMDWRDDHTADDPQMQQANWQLPSFLYAMPFSANRVFLEETSLVARPAVPYQELKQRLDKRLAHMGITVKSVEEEEYCLIPMGGVLPRLPQRVLGIGGTGGMVHPSTGYMVSRMLGAVPVLADAIVEALCAASDKDSDTEQPPGARTAQEAEELSASVWHAIWPVERIRQREFFTFGMDVLLQLNLAQTREFFAAFFSLSDYHWQGFLSARLTFPQLIGFGLSLFVHASNAARANLLVKGIPGLGIMLARLAQSWNYGPSNRADDKVDKVDR